MNESEKLALALELMTEINKNLGHLKDVVRAQEDRISVLVSRMNQLDVLVMSRLFSPPRGPGPEDVK